MFRDSGYAAFTTFALSAVAIALSVMSLISSRRSNRRLIQIEEARDNAARRSSKSAILRGHLVRESNSNGRSATVLVVDNTGDGTARNIAMLLDGEPAADHRAFLRENDFEVLGPRSTKRCQLAITSHSPSPTQIQISWTDGTGESKTYESTL